MLLKKAVTKFKTAITDGESSTGAESNRDFSALSNKSGLRERVLNNGGALLGAGDSNGNTG